jgi:predicted lipopolysaccharide heptosyltransferase III
VRDIVDSSQQLRDIASHAKQDDNSPQPLGPPRWDWQDVRKILVVKLRSIGDTVLATPSLLALQRFLPEAQVDILVEDWVAPILQEHPYLNEVLTMERGSLASRARIAKDIRSRRYDVVYNLHGGTTATLLTRATGARHRVGYASYQYANLHNHQAPSPLLLWNQQKTHSVEQQLALLGWTGVPVTDRPPTTLAVTETAAAKVEAELRKAGLESKRIALIHPAAAFATKQWATKNFARVTEFLAASGFTSVAVAGPTEGQVLSDLVSESKAQVLTLRLSLPEVIALSARSQLFVGNDSGIAHIAAAVGAPSVVIFGSSNIAHWRPWTRKAAEVVVEEMECQPCHGYHCEKFEQPECILRVPVSRVTAAIERIMSDTL